MHMLYLPYELQYDDETRTYCISGQDNHGETFGVGGGPTPETCEQTLRDAVLDVLESHAADGEDRFGDLHRTPPSEGPFLVFTPADVVPIRLRLARARARLRQSDMAERLGITQQAYAKLERPGANPTLRTLLQAEQALGTPLLAWV
jgi:DNA-binding XRE family transcriptional regulator